MKPREAELTLVVPRLMGLQDKRHHTGGQWEMKHEAMTVNLNDNMHARDMEDPQSLPSLAVLPWVSQNCSYPAAMNTCTVNSCLVSDFYTEILTSIPTVTANVMLVYSLTDRP